MKWVNQCCTLSSNFSSFTYLDHHAGEQYSKCGRTKLFFSWSKIDGCLVENVLLKSPSTQLDSV